MPRIKATKLKIALATAKSAQNPADPVGHCVIAAEGMEASADDISLQACGEAAKIVGKGAVTHWMKAEK
jgi:hypothetical protein